MTRYALRRTRFLAFLTLLVAAPITGQPQSRTLTKAYGRAVVDIETSRAQPGGVFGVTIRNGRWASGSTLLDGRRGSLFRDVGALFGLVPVPLDAAPADHRLSLFFPGGRRGGGSTTLLVPVSASARPGRTRNLSSEAMATASGQAALGHARFLLNAIRSRELRGYQLRPLQPPVDAPIGFPFGGPEDFGMMMGPVKDGLMGEQHRGADYDVPTGTPVRSPGSGVVLLARSLIFSGETVAIDHGRGLVSVLSHLSRVTVREGDMVIQGAALGVSGQTGLGALTAHLCFSVYLHSLNVDPEALMDANLWR